MLTIANLSLSSGVFLLMAGGLLAIFSAIVMYIVQPYDAIFKWKLIFGDDGEIFNLWQNPPVDLYIKIYLFNITNAEEFMRGDEKMKVEEIGPYVYREMLLHDEVVFNTNGTISMVPKHPLVWSEELSMGNREDDVFMLPNIALLSIAQVTAEKPYFFRLPINLVIRQTDSQPIVRMTAKEFMFGYESPLTTLGNKFMPDWIYFEKVGLIDRMYDFDGDFETIYTGETDSSISGLIDTYKGSENLKQWKGPHCSNINMASDGTKFKSFIEPNDTLRFFRKSMCRAQTLYRVGEEKTIGSLTAFKYMFEENAMDNGHFDERNKCFCRDGTCLPYGLLDVSDCYYGFPIALSYPHFLDCDESVDDNIIGTKPNRSLHETYFMIQPKSGLPLSLSVKLQINMAMRDISNMAHVERFSNIVVPMLWFEITMPHLPEALENRFDLYLNILPIVDWIGQLACFVVGLCQLTIAIVKVSMSLSKSIQSNNKMQQKYPNIQKYLGKSDAKVYEMTETYIIENDGLCDINLDEEKNYMLEEEPALSEDEDIDSDTKSLSYEEDETDGSLKLINENDAFDNHLSSHTTPELLRRDSCQLGVTSSSIDDINNERFCELHIDEEDLCKSINGLDALDNLV
ncbi:scavenger receptor class B member 1 isoform X2 [Bradysia coprophila]|uniref:scavenger receptor class B member 1 isoform X2 n=1 Tax=Bradysia coprophila TaxID=38358 RepID=UPI00187D789C|nr:scavenger receptor class B member 1 isoform X2 [Bradysia coprophila]